MVEMQRFKRALNAFQGSVDCVAPLVTRLMK